eukprot:TRINITY_DN106979_c0_g1_i1.p1 TRINITY_DN106979_c0_g1~~TRINITY_DN106979_c0_g1_i1.p1  ORF type:complete len:894 (+),score=175.50 TRINITY_DN106979_c0_g1_i1:53-2683(+)
MASAVTEGGGGSSAVISSEDTYSSLGLEYELQASGKAVLPARNLVEVPVRVVARFRPPVTDEEFQDDPVFVLRTGDHSAEAERGVADNATVESLDGRFLFELDCAFSEEADQKSVYDHIGLPAVEDVLAGYNGTILTYGQTGSGKTFTLFGPSLTEPELRGIAPRAAEHLVQGCEEETPEGPSEAFIQCSFLEIYRERMRDLLHPTNQSLRIKELPQRGLIIDGLTQDYVGSAGDVLKALSTGSAWRSVAATRQNQYSSRSHAIFTLYVSRRSLGGDDARERTGKLSLVDLAGSERVSRSQSVGETLEEAKKINTSLTALGKVIDSLVERRTHIPYRDSTLTRVLEEALGGNSRTTLLVAASACAQHLDETVCSLRFATRAQKVSNCAHVNFVYSPEELLPLVSQLQRELALARRELAQHGITPALKGAPQNPMRTGRRCRTGVLEEDLRQRAALNRNNEKDANVSAAFSRVSTRSPDTPCSTSSGSWPPSDTLRGTAEEEEEGGAVSNGQPAPNDKALVASATVALRCLEETLLAQEEALEEARLLMVGQGNEVGFGSGSCSAGGSTASRPASPPSPKADGSDSKARLRERPPQTLAEALSDDALSDRWCALRHAVEARALRWRLQRERHKAEGLHHELGLRNRYTAELERRLEASQAQVALLTQQSQSTTSRDSGTRGPGAAARDRSPNARALPGESRTGSKPRSRMGSAQLTVGAAPAAPAGSRQQGGPEGGAGGGANAEQLRALREAQCALRGEVLELKQEAARRERHIAGLAAEAAARDVRVSALRHEVGVKDALLGCLRKETWRSMETGEEELERLLEAAAAPLASLLRGSTATPQAAAGAPAAVAPATVLGGQWTPVRPLPAVPRVVHR